MKKYVTPLLETAFNATDVSFSSRVKDYISEGGRRKKEIHNYSARSRFEATEKQSLKILQEWKKCKFFPPTFLSMEGKNFWYKNV